MGQNKNSAKIYTSSSQGNLNASFNDTKQIINVTNNKAKSYEELAAKYRDEAKKYRDEAQEYAEQNTNVTMEDIFQVQNFLQGKIDTKQPVGDYALASQIPENVSELNNDLQYATTTQLNNLLPAQTGCNGKFLQTDGEDLEWVNIKGFSLFDTKLSDHILEGEEGFGWALQGTYTLSSYTDFYQKCLAEKTAGVATQTTLGESTITTYNNANGHIFYDIADKAVVDTYYEETGLAWFYGIDTENERIFLPRNKWVGIKGISSTAPVIGNGKSLGFMDFNGHTYGTNITSGSPGLGLYANRYNINLPISGSPGSSGGNLPPDYTGVGVTTDATKSGIIADTSDVIKIDTEKYLYICIGNTMVNEANIDIAKLTTDVQNLETNKANLSAIDGKYTLSNANIIQLGTITGGATTAYSLSNILPDDGSLYAVLLHFNSAANNFASQVIISGDLGTQATARTSGTSSGNSTISFTGWIIVGSDRQIKVSSEANLTVVTLKCCTIRKIGA